MWARRSYWLSAHIGLRLHIGLRAPYWAEGSYFAKGLLWLNGSCSTIHLLPWYILGFACHCLNWILDINRQPRPNFPFREHVRKSAISVYSRFSILLVFS